MNIDGKFTFSFNYIEFFQTKDERNEEFGNFALYLKTICMHHN